MLPICEARAVCFGHGGSRESLAKRPAARGVLSGLCHDKKRAQARDASTLSAATTKARHESGTVLRLSADRITTRGRHATHDGLFYAILRYYWRPEVSTSLLIFFIIPCRTAPGPTSINSVAPSAIMCSTE